MRPSRKDASLNILDALASTIRAKSVVELSNSRYLEREHTSIMRSLSELDL